VPRPQIFTYLLLAFLLERLAAARRGKPPMWIFPLIQTVWTNVHGPILGGLLGSVLILGGAIPGLSPRGRVLWTLSLIPASFIHPQGVKAVTEYLPHLAGEGLFRQTIREWLPLHHPLQRDLPQAPATWTLMGASLILGMAGFVNRRYSRRWGYGLILILLAAAPLAAVRHRDLLAIAFVPAAAAWMPAAFSGRIIVPTRAATVVALSLAAFLAVVPGAGLFRYRPAWPPKIGLWENEFPSGGVQFLGRNKLNGRIFNSYDFGGYLANKLPSSKVFIDGRYFVYGERIYREYLEARDGGPAARRILDRAQADFLLIRYPDPSGYQNLAARARDWRDWALVFWDDESLLYIRRSAASPQWLDAHEYRRLDPTLPPAFEQTDTWVRSFRDLVREAWRARLEAPSALKPALLRALAFEYNGRDGDAAAIYREMLEDRPEHAAALAGLKRLLARHPEGLPPPTPRERLRLEFDLGP
jgi:hypothetical protein